MHVLACCMQAVEEQHFLVDCPFYIIREVSTFGYLAQTTNNGTLGSFRTELPPAWFCCIPHTPVLSRQDV